ncbi:MAG TPA: hypothetical protein VLE97_05565 [Gaiellaceae bacterium]|nr:hypothetical protein [Gaiellaceae bacterium]
MRQRVLLALVLCGLGVAAPLAAHGSTAANKTVHIPLPQPNTAQLSEIDVTAAGNGPVTAHTTNDSALGNLALLYVVSGPSKPHAGASYKVYVLMRRFFARTVAGAADQAVTTEVDNIAKVQEVHQNLHNAVCPLLQNLDKAYESGSNQHTANGTTESLSSGRSQAKQPSKPESVLDDLVVTLSKGECKTEGYDPGNT